MSRKICSKISGVSFKNKDGTKRQDVIRDHCHRGKRLQARREPNNRHDENAIGLWVPAGLGSLQVGYVGSNLSGDLTRHLEDRGRLVVRILDVTGGGEGEYYGVNVQYKLIGRGHPWLKAAMGSVGRGSLSAAGLASRGVRVGVVRAWSFGRRAPELVEVYRGLPGWAQPIVWGFVIAGPIVSVMVVARMFWK